MTDDAAVRADGLPFVLVWTETRRLSHLMHVRRVRRDPLHPDGLILGEATLCRQWAATYDPVRAIADVECRQCLREAFRAQYHPSDTFEPNSIWIEGKPFVIARTRTGFKNHLVFVDPSGSPRRTTLCGAGVFPAPTAEQLDADCRNCLEMTTWDRYRYKRPAA